MMETKIGTAFSNLEFPSKTISYIMSQTEEGKFYLDCLLNIDMPVMDTMFLIVIP
jgi:hypothetical protein